METLPQELIGDIARRLDSSLDVVNLYTTCKATRQADVVDAAYADCHFIDCKTDCAEDVVGRMADRVRAEKPFQHNKAFAFQVDGVGASNTYIRLQRLQWGSSYSYRALIYRGWKEVCTIEASRGEFSNGVIYCNCPSETLMAGIRIPLIYMYLGIHFVAKMAEYGDGMFNVVRNGWLEYTSKDLEWFWRLVECRGMIKRKLYKDLVFKYF